MTVSASFIVATYGRPEVLDATLRALVLQRRPDWEAIVVGDCCDERTEAVVRALGDPRVRYYNLTHRYGEQGGPNSVGLAVARGALVTFLNHDDLLLPDHLDHVVDTFGTHPIDVLVTRAVKVRWFGPRRDGDHEIICGATVPGRVRIEDAISHRMHALEPSSAWTITRSAAVRVGPWRSSQTTLRLPFQDWLLRLARTTRRWRFDDRVTGLSLTSDYRRDAPEALALVELLARSSPDEVRSVFVPVAGAPSLATADAASGLPTRRPCRARLRRRLGLVRDPAGLFRRVLSRVDERLAPVGLLVYRRTGLDYGPLPARILRLGPGRAARGLLAHRTGEAMPDHAGLPAYLADPESLRVV